MATARGSPGLAVMAAGPARERRRRPRAVQTGGLGPGTPGGVPGGTGYGLGNNPGGLAGTATRRRDRSTGTDGRPAAPAAQAGRQRAADPTERTAALQGAGTTPGGNGLEGHGQQGTAATASAATRPAPQGQGGSPEQADPAMAVSRIAGGRQQSGWQRSRISTPAAVRPMPPLSTTTLTPVAVPVGCTRDQPMDREQVPAAADWAAMAQSTGQLASRA